MPESATAATIVVVPAVRSVRPDVARRYLALHHLLAPPRGLAPEPASIETVMARLGSLQFDPLGVAGRNHDLILHARIEGYDPSWTTALLYRDRRIFETMNKALCLVPTAELPWYRLAWDRGRERHLGGALAEHADLVEHVLARIGAEGPLSSAAFEREPAIDWYWGPTSRVRAVLEALWEAGILGLARREGNRRFYDLVERLFPAELLARREPERAQLRHKLLSRYRAHGLLGSGGNAELWLGLHVPGQDGRRVGAPLRAELLAELVAEGDLTPVAVEGVRGQRYVPSPEWELLERARSEGEAGAAPGGAPAAVSLLAPLDPLCWDRDLLRSLYGFDYVWEVYVPAAKRRWGYYVLPLLFGDRLVGRIEPRIDRRARTVNVVGLWFEPGFEPAAAGFVPAFRAALAAYLGFAAAERLVWGPGLRRWERLVGHPSPRRNGNGGRDQTSLNSPSTASSSTSPPAPGLGSAPSPPDPSTPSPAEPSVGAPAAW